MQGTLFCHGHTGKTWPQYGMEDNVVLLDVFALGVDKAMVLLECDVVWRFVNRVQG